VLDLQEQLTTTENQIGFARQHYNATVLDYNTGIATFPSVLIAGPFGFRPEQFFDAEPEAQQVPQVNLSNLAPPPPAAPPAMPPTVPPSMPPTTPPSTPPTTPPTTPPSAG
jgi:hypothetical protein